MKKESFIIQGLAGAKPLKGTIKINGAKNAALKAMAATILFDGPVELRNIPQNEDVHTMAEILDALGAKVGEFRDGTVTIDPTTIASTAIDKTLAGTMRSSVVLTGPLLSRYGKVTFPAPGGCVIGARPIDQFIKGYKSMGVTVVEGGNDFTISLPDRSTTVRSNDAQKHVSITFDKKTVGGTETLMMAAVLGNDIITLNNCAEEPEIVNVAEWLNECGADIKGVGTDSVVINGTNGKLLMPKKPYIAIPDRIEAGSYIILGALCACELTLTDCRPDHMELLIDLLTKSGVPIAIGQDKDANGNSSISIKRNTKLNSAFRPFDVSTKEYPGFATDYQAQIVTYLTQTSGTSKVTENIFEGRFKYVNDLQKMGAKITENGPREVHITGPSELKQSTPLFAHDLRAGFAVVMAALVANGNFIVSNAHFIDRGYEKLEERLVALGAKIKRVQS